MLERYRHRDEIHVRMTPAMIEARDEFAARFGSAEGLVHQACYVCGGTDFERLSETDRYGFFYPTGMCRGCGNVQQELYYPEEVIVAFYSHHYRRIYSPLSPEGLFERQRRRGLAIWAFCANDLGDAPRVLEIGAGAGGILNVFREEGCIVTGLDYDDDYLDWGRRRGLSLLKGDLGTVKLPQEFDLVILSHVLEHVVEPARFLERIAPLLADHGMVYVEVPSLENVAAGGYDYDLLNYLQNAHTTHFHEKSLYNTAHLAGFEVVRFDPFIRCLLRRRDRPMAPSAVTKDPDYARALLTEIERRRRRVLNRVKCRSRRYVLSALERLGMRDAAVAAVHRIRGE